MITYTTQPDGTYVRTGKLPPRTRKVRLQVVDEGSTGNEFGEYTLAEAEAILADAYDLTKSRRVHKAYNILPLVAELMPEEVKQKFQKINEFKKENKPVVTCAHEGCSEVVEIKRGRQPKIFLCPIHKPKTIVAKKEPVVTKITNNKLTILCAFDGCYAEFPRTRGRYPKRFCQIHEGEK